jgi:hypothetical protein
VRRAYALEHRTGVKTFRRFRPVPPTLYEVDQWSGAQPRRGYPYRIRLVEDLSIEGVPCRAHAAMAIRHEEVLWFGEVVSTTLARRYRATIGLCVRVECEQGTRIAFDWNGVFRRAACFTPIEPFVLNRMPLAAGHEVSTSYGMAGTLSRDHQVAWFTIPNGSTFEQDPDDFRTIHATLAHDVRVATTTLASGTRVAIAPRGRVIVSWPDGERAHLDPSGATRP